MTTLCAQFRLVSPYKRKPRFRRVAVPQFAVTERDVEILKLVAHHRFIRSTHIVELLCGSSQQGVVRRLELLFHGGYLSRPASQLDWYRAGGGSRPLVYAMGNAGIDLLSEQFGFRRAAVDWTAKARTAKRGEIEHALEITDVMVAVEKGCRSRGNMRVLYLDDILSSVAPMETRENPQPYYWPVPLTWRGKEIVIHPIPDRIFGIEALGRPEGRNKKFFFLEADRGTMPVVRLDLTKTSYLRKLLAYGYTYQRDLHTKMYGFNNMRLLTVTKGKQRIEGIQEAHREHTWQLCSPKVFLFADRPSLLSAEDPLGGLWVVGRWGRGETISG